MIGRCAGEREGGPYEHGGGDVRGAFVGVAPAAVGILMPGKPAEAAHDQFAQRALALFIDEATAVGRSMTLDDGQSTDRGSGGESGAGQASDPVSVGGGFRQ